MVVTRVSSRPGHLALEGERDERGGAGTRLTATPRDQDGRGATICECGWVSKPGVDAQPFLEAREHILSVRAGEASA
jgi:hypothetical protein